MTDAGWTAGKPTEAGWYWFRTEVTEEEICRIYQDADDVWWATCTEWDEVYKLDDVLIGAEFLGPLSPSTYHQGRVAGELFGLQQGLLIAYIFESGTAKQVIEGIKSRIAEIEQQTQDGKP